MDHLLSIFLVEKALAFLDAIFRSRILPVATEREKKAPPGARKRVTEIAYISLDLYHRAISPPAPPPPPACSIFPALFFLLSLLIFLRVPSPSCVSPFFFYSPFQRSVSRHALSADERTSTRVLSRGRGAETVTRGASTSIFLRFIAARLRNASNAVHAA